MGYSRDYGKKFHLVAQDQVCKVKGDGGLGIKLEEFHRGTHCQMVVEVTYKTRGSNAITSMNEIWTGEEVMEK